MAKKETKATAPKKNAAPAAKKASSKVMSDPVQQPGPGKLKSNLSKKLLNERIKIKKLGNGIERMRRLAAFDAKHKH